MNQICYTILEIFLEDVKKSTNLAVEFSSFCQELRASGICVIPTKGKTPISKYETEEDKEKANKRAITTEAAIVLQEWLAVIDIDCLETFYSTTGITIEELEQVATVETGKGYHIYILNDNDEKIPRISNPVYGFEILKGKNEIVMLAGSRIYHEKLRRNVYYNVIQPKVWTQEELIEANPKFQRVFELTASCVRKNGNREIQPPPQFKEFKEVEIDFEKLKEVLSAYYHEGDRQNIALYVAGLLAKSGVDIVDAIEFISELADTNNDPEKKMRVAAVIKTYQKFEHGLDEEIKGIQGLKELGIPKEEILNCININRRKQQQGETTSNTEEQKQRIFDEEESFFIQDNTLYCLQWGVIEREGKKHKVPKFIEIGPGIEILGKFYDEDMKKYYLLVKYDNKLWTNMDLTPEGVRQITQDPILSPKLWNLYVHKENIKAHQKGIGIILARTGWVNIAGKEFFATPHLVKETDRIIYDTARFSYTNKFVINEKDQLHEIAKSELKKGSQIGLMFVIAASSILLKDLDCSFSVLLSGKPGGGKTLTARVACNMFYCNKDKFTLGSTQTYRERLLFQFCDLPILMDEKFLEKDEKIEVLVYLVESQRTKGRANVKLGTYEASRRNVLILTAEREVNFTALGEARRNIHISFEPIGDEKINLFGKILNKRIVGGGYDYISFYAENKEKMLQKFEHIQRTSFIPEQAMLCSLVFLEEFYRERFPEMEKLIIEICDEHRKKTDYFSIAWDSFMAFFAENLGKFYYPEANYRIVKTKDGTEEIPNIPTTFYGFVHDSKIYIVPDALKTFCITKNIDRKTFLNELCKRNRLISNDREYYKVRKSPIKMELPATRFYCILLEDLDFNIEPEIEDMREVEEPF